MSPEPEKRGPFKEKRRLTMQIRNAGKFDPNGPRLPPLWGINFGKGKVTHSLDSPKGKKMWNFQKENPQGSPKRNKCGLKLPFPVKLTWKKRSGNNKGRAGFLQNKKGGKPVWSTQKRESDNSDGTGGTTRRA